MHPLVLIYFFLIYDILSHHITTIKIKMQNFSVIFEKFPYVANWDLFYTSHHCHIHSLFSLSVWNIFIIHGLAFLSTNFINCNCLFLFFAFQFVKGYVSCILIEGHILNFTFFFALHCIALLCITLHLLECAELFSVLLDFVLRYSHVTWNQYDRFGG